MAWHQWLRDCSIVRRLWARLFDGGCAVDLMAVGTARLYICLFVKDVCGAASVSACFVLVLMRDYFVSFDSRLDLYTLYIMVL